MAISVHFILTWVNEGRSVEVPQGKEFHSQISKYYMLTSCWSKSFPLKIITVSERRDFDSLFLKFQMVSERRDLIQFLLSSNFHHSHSSPNIILSTSTSNFLLFFSLKSISICLSSIVCARPEGQMATTCVLLS